MQNSRYEMETTNDNEELNLKYFFNFLIRNKLSILVISFSSFLVFCLYSLSLKRVWSGQFQIVLNNSSNSSFNSLFEGTTLPVETLFNLTSSSQSSLATEVGILESPSLLLPIYKNLISIKKELNPKYKPKSFENWKKTNLQIKLKRGTSILDISYKDKQKENIKPTLTKIAQVYQKYSGKNKRRSIELIKNYNEEQIRIFKKKSSDSIRIAQEYAIDQDLTMLDSASFQSGKQLGTNNLSLGIDLLSGSSPRNSFGSNSLGNITSVEMARVSAANEIQNIDIQIRNLEELNNDFEQLQYIVSQWPNIASQAISEDIKKIDAIILDLESRFNNNYERLRLMKFQRTNLEELLKKKTIAYLKAMRMNAEAKMKSAMRPKEVLLTYKELIRQANRDEATLIQMEDLSRVINLEEAKMVDPWELITSPTLKDYPVAPSRKSIGIIGLLSGFFISVIFAYLKEKKGDKIFEEEILENILDSKIIEKLYIEGNETNDIFLDEIINLNDKKEIRFLVSESFEEKDLEKIKKLNFSSNKKILFFRDLRNVKEDQIIIFITSLDLMTYKEASKIRDRLKLINQEIYGIVMFKKNPGIKNS